MSSAQMFCRCPRQYTFSRRRRGAKVRAVVTDNRSCRSHERWIGVWPLGAQVRRTTGWSMKPLSSRKTMLRPCRRAFFLFAANAHAASARSPFRLALGRAVPVSGSSSPTRPVSATHGRGGTARRTPPRSLPPRASASTALSCIQRREDRAGAIPSAAPSVPARASVGVPAPDGSGVLPRPRPGTGPAIATPNLPTILRRARPTTSCHPLRATEWLVGVAALAPAESLEVS